MIWRRAPLEGQWKEIRIDRGDVRFLVAGEGKPLILIHGLSGSVHWWSHNIPALSKRFRVYALDLLEYDPDAARFEFFLPEAGRRIRKWMDAIGLESASLIGHSMGGAISVKLAVDWPESVEKLVLVNAAAIFPKSPIRLNLPHLVFNVPHFSPTLVPVLLQDAWRAGPRLLLTAARDLLTADLRPILPEVQAETLVIWGEHDGILPRPLAGEICALIPRSHLLVLPRAGHNPMWEQAAEFNAAVVEFLVGRSETSVRLNV